MLMPGRSGSFINGEWTEGRNGTLDHLTIDDRSGNQPTEYVARESIEFLAGFESEEGDEFVAYIDPEATSGTGGEGSGLYPYGFNGQEKSNEIKGEGSSYTAEYWEYDPRIGRRWNLDPKPTRGISEYSAFTNNPILFSDPSGDTSGVGTRIVGGLKAIGGLAEMVIGGVGGAATSWTGIGAVAGGIAVVHGADVTSAGLRQLWTGEETSTFTQQGISRGLQGLGVSKIKAEVAAGYTDAGISILLSAGSSMAKDGTFVASRPLIQVAKAESRVVEVEAQVAKATGNIAARTYPGVVSEYAKQTAAQLNRTIRSTGKTIAEHEGWLKNPLSKPSMTAEKWAGMSEQAKKGLLTKWQNDLSRNKAYLEIAEGLLKAKQ